MAKRSKNTKRKLKKRKKARKLTQTEAILRRG